MKESLKRIQRNAIFSGVLFIVLGVILFAWPHATLEILVRVSGTALGIFGLIQVIRGLRNRDIIEDNAMELTLGIIAVVIGIMIVCRPMPLIELIPFLICVYTFFMGCYELSQAFIFFRLGVSNWWLALIFALVNIVVSIYLFIHPFEGAQIIIRCVAALLVYNGAVTLIINFAIRKRIKVIKEKVKYVVDNANGDIVDEKKD